MLGMDLGGETPDSIKAAVKEKFWFDLAGMPFPTAIRSLMLYVGSDRVTYGSDCPHIPAKTAKGLAREMEMWMGESWSQEGERRRVLVGNAEALIEKLKGMKHLEVKAGRR